MVCQMLKCKIIVIYFQEPKSTAILTNLTKILTPSKLLETLASFTSALFELPVSLCNFYHQKKNQYLLLRVYGLD